MLLAIVVLYILQLVTAPAWCYVLCWLTIAGKALELLTSIIKGIVKGVEK